MSRTQMLRVSLVLILTALCLIACGNDSAHFTIEGTDNLTFTPDTITVKPGQSVELILVDKGTLPHTFTVPDLNIEVQMRAGETNTVTFTAPAAGEYRFFSGVLSDLDTMKGKIIVK